jgi:hypothetical protein
MRLTAPLRTALIISFWSVIFVSTARADYLATTLRAGLSYDEIAPFSDRVTFEISGNPLITIPFSSNGFTTDHGGFHFDGIVPQLHVSAGSDLHYRLNLQFGGPIGETIHTETLPLADYSIFNHVDLTGLTHYTRSTWYMDDLTSTVSSDPKFTLFTHFQLVARFYVPEPSSLSLLLMIGAAAALTRRR